MRNSGNLINHIKHRLHLLALSCVLLSIYQNSLAVELISEYEEWLSEKSKEDLTLEKKNFDRGLLKLECSERINFEFTNKNRRQVKASCGEEWRRFLKVPKPIAELVTPRSVIEAKGAKEVAFAFNKDLEKGYLLNSKDLDLVEGQRFIPSNAISKPENYKGLYLQRDVAKGDLLLKTDLKKAVYVFVALVAQHT